MKKEKGRSIYKSIYDDTAYYIFTSVDRYTDDSVFNSVNDSSVISDYFSVIELNSVYYGNDDFIKSKHE